MKNTTDIKKFIKRVLINPKNDCWEWTAAKNERGYGFFYLAKTNKNVRAHRWIYHYMNPNSDKGLECCHTCDNPPCVNPNHLFLGTHKQNMEDMAKKGRAIKPYYHKNKRCKRGHLYSDDNKVYRYNSDGTIKRYQCKKCSRTLQKKNRDKQTLTRKGFLKS